MVANKGSDNVSVLIGDGDGGFADAVNFTTGNQPACVALGDINADGILDVIVANSTGWRATG